jgi:hypothetical protein
VQLTVAIVPSAREPVILVIAAGRRPWIPRVGVSWRRARVSGAPVITPVIINAAITSQVIETTPVFPVGIFVIVVAGIGSPAAFIAATILIISPAIAKLVLWVVTISGHSSSLNQN